MPAVNIFQPIPPDWYRPTTDIERCIALVRNGNAVFWHITLPNGHPDYGLFIPGSGHTPRGATLYAPLPKIAGLSLPGLVQHDPAAPDYPVVTTGEVHTNIAASGNGVTFSVE